MEFFISHPITSPPDKIYKHIYMHKFVVIDFGLSKFSKLKLSQEYSTVNTIHISLILIAELDKTINMLIFIPLGKLNPLSNLITIQVFFTISSFSAFLIGELRFSSKKN